MTSVENEADETNTGVAKGDGDDGTGLRRKLEAIAEAFVEIAPLWRDAASRYVELDSKAPALLAAAVANHGLVVPVSQLSFGEVYSLVEMCDEKGTSEAASLVRTQYDAIFDTVGARTRFERGWAEHAILARRLPILSQALRAHELELFATSVPTLLAQAEGIVADATKHAGMMRQKQLIAHYDTLASADDWSGRMLKRFVSETLLVHFKHGDPIPIFSRHAILHGADLDYSTETNSRTAILLIDLLSMLTEGMALPGGT